MQGENGTATGIKIKIGEEDVPSKKGEYQLVLQEPPKDNHPKTNGTSRPNGKTNGKGQSVYHWEIVLKLKILGTWPNTCALTVVKPWKNNVRSLNFIYCSKVGNSHGFFHLFIMRCNQQEMNNAFISFTLFTCIVWPEAVSVYIRLESGRIEVIYRPYIISLFEIL